MFENSLVDLDKKRNSRGLRWWIWTIAIIFHLAIFGSVLFAQYWAVPAVEEPPINVVFMNAVDYSPIK